MVRKLQRPGQHPCGWVSLGNVVSGSLFVAAGYWIASASRSGATAPETEERSERKAP